MRTVALFVCCLHGAAAAFSGAASRLAQSRVSAPRTAAPAMIDLDLKGKTAFVAGVGDSTGYGWAICKALAEVRRRSEPLSLCELWSRSGAPGAVAPRRRPHALQLELPVF